MSGVGGQFWAGPATSAVPAALTALAADYTVAMGRPVATRRTWLDSVDFRLYRSGMALMADGGPGRRANACSSSAAPTARPSPPGPTPSAGRACWPVFPTSCGRASSRSSGCARCCRWSQVSGTSVTGRVLDVEGKTVLRLVHERPATISGSRDRLPGGLWLIPLRGYDAVGARAARIAHRAGLVRDTTVAATRRRCSPRGSIPTRPEAGDGARAARPRGGGQGAGVLPRRAGGRLGRHGRRTSTSSSCTTSGSRSGAVARRSSCSATSCRPPWSPG